MELSVVLTGASFHFLPLNSPPYPFIFPTTCYSLIFKLYLVNFCLLTSNSTLIIYLSVGKYFFPNGDSSSYFSARASAEIIRDEWRFGNHTL